MALTVKLESETGTSANPARVLVYDDDQLVSEITARIEPKQGADGGYYPCITFTES